MRRAPLIDLDPWRGKTAGGLLTRSHTPGGIFDGFRVVRGPAQFLEQVGGDVITTVTATRVFAFSEGIDLG